MTPKRLIGGSEPPSIRSGFVALVLLALVAALLGSLSCASIPVPDPRPTPTPLPMPDCSEEHSCDCSETHESCTVYRPCCDEGEELVDAISDPACPVWVCRSPAPPEPEPWSCPLPMPDCAEVGQTCSTAESPCHHNPSQDPEHCEEAPACPAPPPAPPPIEPPEPPSVTTCPYDLPAAERADRAKPHGQGLDCSIRFCPGNAWCLEHTGKDQRCCPPAPEGATYATACAAVLLGQACPSWQYRFPGAMEWKPCLAPEYPEMSCDHQDHDDPKTPEYEGTNPECLADGDPVETGYWVVAHGLGHVRCGANGSWSNPVAVDK